MLTVFVTRDRLVRLRVLYRFFVACEVQWMIYPWECSFKRTKCNSSLSQSLDFVSGVQRRLVSPALYKLLICLKIGGCCYSTRCFLQILKRLLPSLLYFFLLNIFKNPANAFCYLRIYYNSFQETKKGLHLFLYKAIL